MDLRALQIQQSYSIKSLNCSEEIAATVTCSTDDTKVSVPHSHLTNYSSLLLLTFNDPHDLQLQVDLPKHKHSVVVMPRSTATTGETMSSVTPFNLLSNC